MLTEPDTRSPELKAVLSTEARNSLPDSAFACTEGGVRKYPHHHADGSIDLPHLRNALSRLAQAGTTSCGAAHLRAHAKAEGIGEEKDLHPEDAGPYDALQMEIKSASVQDFSLTEEGEVLVAFAEIGKVDREKDYTFPGAIPSKDVPVSAHNHSSWPQRGGLPPTGRGHTEEKDGLAVFRGKFFMDTTHGRDAYNTVKGMKELQQWSYGYEVLEKAEPPAGLGAKRGLKSLDVFEISPVLIGAGGRTFTMDIKSADLAFLESDEAIQTLLKGGPLAGLPFAEMSARVLTDVEAFTGRAVDLVDLRLKEGRAISSARMEELTRHRSGLSEALAAIDRLIASATPTTGDEEAEGKHRAARVRSRLAMANVELTSVH